MSGITDIELRTCIRCEERKPIDEFPIHRRGAKSPIRRKYCHPCYILESRGAYKKHSDKRKAEQKASYYSNVEENRRRARESNIYNKYGITQAQYDKMLGDQGGVCMICGGNDKSRHMINPLVIDHDHTCCPGEKTCGNCVRGLLCVKCNTGIGNLKDDPNILLAAAAYLMQSTDILSKAGNL